MVYLDCFKAELKRSFFIATSLIEADFADTDIKETFFRHCNLNRSNFCGALNYVIDPLVNKVKKAKFSFPEVLGLLHGFDIKII
ncbi:pentapeptide repeat-containing protein [bacterium]|nr:pentapeptide repeat-containing protein [bacterium]